MIPRDRPSSGIESITEGLDGRTTDTATGRVVDRVCRHRHGEVLMGGKATVKLWRIDPESSPHFIVFPFADQSARTSPTLTHHQSACTDQPHMTSPAWSWTLLFLFLTGLPLFRSFPQPTSAPITDSPSFPFWLMFSSFGSFLSHTLCSFVPNVCQHGLCAGSYSIYTCPYLL